MKIVFLILTLLIYCLTPGCGRTAELPYLFPQEYYRFTQGPAAKLASGFVILPKKPLEEVKLNISESNIEGNKIINVNGAKGQLVPYSFVIYTKKKLSKINVKINDLKNERGQKISKENFTSLVGMRQAQPKSGIKLRGEQVVATRFLPPLEAFDLSDGSFREIYGEVNIPQEAAPGIYQGLVEIGSEEKIISNLQILLKVFPFQLRQPPQKKYGMYYSLNDSLRRFDGEKKHIPEDSSGRKRVLLELALMRDSRAADILVLDSGITYRSTPKGIDISYDEIESALALLREAGVPQAKVVIRTRFEDLAGLLGHSMEAWVPGKELEGVGYENLSGDRRFLDSAKQALMGLRQFHQRYPEYDLVLSHYSDEIDYPPGRLPLYIELTKAARQVPEFKMYVTFQVAYRPKRTERLEKLRKLVDPFVDIRGHRGEYYEWWLAAGANPQEYAEELRRSGDEVWLYYNPEAPERDAHYYRLINGLWFWKQEAVTGMVPWTFFYHRRGQREIYDAFASNSEKRGIPGFAFPSWKDGVTPVTTRILEGSREGAYDLYYLFTLSEMVKEAKARGNKSPELSSAENWLSGVHRLVPGPDELSDQEKRWDPAWSPGTTIIPAPLSAAAQKRLPLEKLDQIRAQTAGYIEMLQEKSQP